MVLQHNLVSMYSNRQLGITKGNRARYTEKLSSGYRINRSADDAAGLAISEKMRSQIRGLMRASDNCQDGISLIQTADGALENDHAMVQRIRELCVQASNDAVLTRDDQQKIQDEIDEIIKEIDRVADETEFNKKKLLDGSFGDGFEVAPHPFIRTLDKGTLIAPDAVDEISGLKVIYVDYDFETEQKQTGMKTKPGYDSLKNALKTEIVPRALDAIISAFPSAFDDLKNSTVGIGLRLYTDPSSTTMASAGTSVWFDGSGNVFKDNQTYTLSVNMGYLEFDSNGNLKGADTKRGREALETTIVHEMMHSIMQESMTNGMIGARGGIYDSSNAFPQWFVEGVAQAACGAASPYNDWLAGLTITGSTSDEKIKNLLAESSRALLYDTSASRYSTGYLASMYLAHKINGGGVTDTDLKSGMNSLLGSLRNGESLNDIAASIGYSDLSDFEHRFATDSDSISFVRDLISAVRSSNGGGGLVKGFAATDLLDNSAHDTVLFELDTTVDTVANYYPSGTIRYTDGGRGGGGNPSGTGRDGGPMDVPEPKEYTGDGQWLQVGANAGQGIYLKIRDMHARSMGMTGGIDSIQVFGHMAANGGIIRCDEALNYISEERSKLGAYQNRLEYTIKVDDISAENLQDAESRIRDTDMAEEMTCLAKENILEQAGINMLSQANQQGQRVLSLLNG